MITQSAESDNDLKLARACLNIYGNRFKALHVQNMGTGGRVKMTVFLTPLGSKDIPEPDTKIIAVDDLVPPRLNGR